jgi:hypothetical protein
MNIEKCWKHDGPLAIFATVKTQLSLCKLWYFLAEQLVLGSEQLALKDTKQTFLGPGGYSTSEIDML